jgi:hypothetical protein
MFLSDARLASLCRKAHPWRAHAKLSRSRGRRPSQLPHGPEAEQAPGAHPTLLAPFHPNLPGALRD